MYDGKRHTVYGNSKFSCWLEDWQSVKNNMNCTLFILSYQSHDMLCSRPEWVESSYSWAWSIVKTKVMGHRKKNSSCTVILLYTALADCIGTTTTTAKRPQLGYISFILFVWFVPEFLFHRDCIHSFWFYFLFWHDVLSDLLLFYSIYSSL